MSGQKNGTKRKPSRNTSSSLPKRGNGKLQENLSGRPKTIHQLYGGHSGHHTSQRSKEEIIGKRRKKDERRLRYH